MLSGSLEMYQRFYGEKPNVDFTEVSNLINATKLREFIIQFEQTCSDFPLEKFLSLFKLYDLELHSFSMSILNAVASGELIKKFGPVQPGVDKNGVVTVEATQQIVETHTGLIKDRQRAVAEAQQQSSWLRTLLTQFRIAIFSVLTEHQQRTELEVVENNKAESIVENHLNQVNGSEVVVYQHVKNSKEAQRKRLSGVRNRYNDILKRLQKLSNLAEGIFAKKVTELPIMI